MMEKMNKLNNDIPDTSATYDDLVGYVAEENLKRDLFDIVGESNDKELLIDIAPKKVDPDFPEEWQDLIVNFHTEESYYEFMKLIGQVPTPRLNRVVYESTPNLGILDFL